MFCELKDVLLDLRTEVFIILLTLQWGWGNSVMASFSVCQAGCPGLSPALSVCFQKVEFYQDIIVLSLPVPTTGSPKAVHVLSCLCDNACERSPAICHNSRASCPVSRLLSVPEWPACCWTGKLIWFKQTKQKIHKINMFFLVYSNFHITVQHMLSFSTLKHIGK